MNTKPTRQRRITWGLRGGLILATVAIILGGIFNLLIASFQGEIPPAAGASYWVVFFLRSSLAWGGGGFFFGALLGIYASMIWRPNDTN